MPLPPEKATRSKPIAVYFHRFSAGGTSAAQSFIVTTPCFLPRATNCLVADLPQRVVVVVEEHHRRLRRDRPLELLGRLDLHDLHAGVADGVVVAEAVRLQHDHLALHAGEVRQVDDLLAVGAGEHAGGAERHRRRGPGGDHRRLGLHQGRDPLADPVVELVERHEVPGRVVDRLHHLGRHQRRRHVGVGAGGVDERPHAQLLEVSRACWTRRRTRRARCRQSGRRSAARWTAVRRRCVGSACRLLNRSVPQRAATSPIRTRSSGLAVAPESPRALAGQWGSAASNTSSTRGRSAMSLR